MEILMNFLVKFLVSASTLLLFLSIAETQAVSGDFSSYSQQVVSIAAKPTGHFQEIRLLVLHPMIKNRDIIIEHRAKLTWDGERCTKTITDFKQRKGKTRGETGVGKSFNYSYIPENLKQFCTASRISGWHPRSGLRLDGAAFNGFEFTANVEGKKKKSILYLSGNGDIHAISFGFPEEGISHDNNMKEDATLWYFRKTQGNLGLYKIVEITVQKKSGIPVIKKSIQVFSGF